MCTVMKCLNLQYHKKTLTQGKPFTHNFQLWEHLVLKCANNFSYINKILS